MDSERVTLRGRMRLRVAGADGTVLAERRARNIVLRGGAELVARRFAGVDAAPINRIGLGFGREAADAGITELTGPSGDAVPASALTSPVAPGDFTISADRPGFIQVSVASVLHPAVELEGVSEAGLLGDDQLYNQVVFEPVTLKVGQDVTFFWEIDFPFGH
jgi:hypothetical protein